MTQAQTQLAVPSDQKIDLFSAGGFALAQRIANALTTSNAVPEAFRQVIEKRDSQGNVTYQENPAALGNALVAIEVARSVGMSIVSVMQNADVIQGKLRWSSKFQIACINASGRFTPLQFEFKQLGKIRATYREKGSWNKERRRYDYTEHQVEIDDVECRAWAHSKATGKRVDGPAVSMRMAVEEGWYGKDGSKWQGSMAELMLQYRAGTFFGSIHAPDIIMGMGQPAEVERDLVEADGVQVELPPAPEAMRAPPPAPAEPPRKQKEKAPEAVEDAKVVPAEVVPAEQAPSQQSLIDGALEEADAPSQPPPPKAAPPAPAPAPHADEMATLGMRQNLRLAAQTAGVDLGTLLQAVGASVSDTTTLEGLTVAQFRAAKGRLS